MRTELLSALVLLSACGPETLTPQMPALKQARLLPPQTSFVAAISFSQLRATEIYQTGYKLLIDELRDSESDALTFLEILRTRCGIDIFNDLQWGLMAGGADVEDTDEMAFLLGVSFDEEKFNLCTAGLGWKPEARGQVAYYQDMGAFVIWPSPKVVAFAVDDDAMGFLLQVANANTSSGPSAELSALMQRVDTGATFWGVATNLGGEDSLYESLSLDEFTEHQTHPLMGSLSIDLRRGIKIRNDFRFPSENDASRVAADWNKLLSFAIPVGAFSSYLGKVLIRSEASSAIALAELDVAETQSLRQLAESTYVAERDRERRSDKEWEDGQAERDADSERERLANEQQDKAEHEAEEKRQAALREEQRLAAERLEVASQGMRKSEAKAHSDQGRAFLDAGVFDKAVEEFRAANALVPHADFLYNIAFSFDNQRSAQVQALDYYQRYLAAAPAGTMAQVSRRRVAQLTKKLRSEK